MCDIWNVCFTFSKNCMQFLFATLFWNANPPPPEPSPKTPTGMFWTEVERLAKNMAHPWCVLFGCWRCPFYSSWKFSSHLSTWRDLGILVPSWFSDMVLNIFETENKGGGLMWIWMEHGFKTKWCINVTYHWHTTGIIGRHCCKFSVKTQVDRFSRH